VLEVSVVQENKLDNRTEISYSIGMLNLLLNKFQKRYLLVYRKRDGETKSYEIDRPRLSDSVPNKQEGRNNVGFKAYCFVRGEVRSFRHDGVISITKL